MFTVWCVPRQHARWGLERSTVGTLCPVAAPNSPVAHRTCPVRSDFAAWHLTLYCSRPMSAGYRCSVGSPDMSGAHRTVWWIIAEHAPEKPESGWFERSSAWCTGHFSVHTEHCPMRHWQHTLKSFAPNLFESPTEFPSWFVLNLMHLW